MKTPNRLKMMALIALITIGASWGVTYVSAQNQTTPINGVKEVTRDDPFFRTGMFGITQNQTARLNIFNGGSGEPGDDDDRVELSFVDGDGNILSQKVYEIGAGKSAFLDFKGSEIVGRDSKRSQVRVVVRFVGTPDTRLAGNCIPTLEVFDNESGETRFLLPAVQKVQKVNSVVPAN
jgi:hypothetical protein